MQCRCTFVLINFATACLAFSPYTLARQDEPVAIGNRLEPFVDEYLIESFSGEARLQLHPPVAREAVISHDEPWEGNTCTYHVVFHDGDGYRMYYRGSHNADFGSGRIKAHSGLACYAESRDGIHWVKPNLGLFEFEGSKENNIVYENSFGNFAPFKDDNPNAAPDAAYKAIAGYKVGGLYAYKSPDGIHWQKLTDELIITEGRFDSLNLAFYDAHRGCYAAYVRDSRDGVRDIKTCTSKDFIHWTDPDWIEHPGQPVYSRSERSAANGRSRPNTQLYTNAIKPYARAPHILLSLPKRFVSNRNPSGHPAIGVSDAVFMTSRDGVNFHYWPEAIVRPGLQESRWVNRNNLPAWGVVETRSHIAGNPPELSMYATEDYYTGDASKLRRYTWRLDGFVSIHAPFAGGQALTKPILFTADDSESSPDATDQPEVRLELNVSTSAAGSVLVEIQDRDGRPVPGFTFEDCEEILGDSIRWPVRWKEGADLSSLAGKPIRIRFQLTDADVYALKFRPL